jgi:hypothetical protein
MKKKRHPFNLSKKWSRYLPIVREVASKAGEAKRRELSRKMLSPKKEEYRE